MDKRIWLLLLVMIPMVSAEQVLVVHLRYDDGFISVVDKTTTLGYYPDRLYQPDSGYRLEIVSVDDNNLYSFRFNLPVDVFYDAEVLGVLEGGIIRLNETDFSLIVPYFDDAKEINFYNERNYLVASANLVEDKLSPQTIFPTVSISIIILLALILLIISRRKIRLT
ncbi:MAG TPA: hypothetical protein VJH97_02725 [Candidatus Nanoarchaeia archaeon]|nr:hypothetical protein [Candidatus Nanoarchaeia archaeon]